jgi:hypothetical protein
MSAIAFETAGCDTASSEAAPSHAPAPSHRHEDVQIPKLEVTAEASRVPIHGVRPHQGGYQIIEYYDYSIMAPSTTLDLEERHFERKRGVPCAGENFL